MAHHTLFGSSLAHRIESPDAEQMGQAINAFVRGHTQLLSTSAALHWPHLLMEEHLLKADEWPPGHLNGPVLALWETTIPLRCDHPDANGKFVPQLVPPGVLSLYVTGGLAPVKPSVPVKGLICGLDSAFFDGVLEEIRDEDNLRSIADGVVTQDKRCFRDEVITDILLSLKDEMRNGGRQGPIFVEQQTRALATRLLCITRRNESVVWQRELLDEALLRRLSKRLSDEDTSTLRLSEIAKEAGCSKRQLLRVFLEKTGRSPHQYVIDLRLEKARQMMLQRSLTLTDIAVECGFSSHPHFTQVFRSRFRIAPSLFRRSLDP